MSHAPSAPEQEVPRTRSGISRRRWLSAVAGGGAAVVLAEGSAKALGVSPVSAARSLFAPHAASSSPALLDFFDLDKVSLGSGIMSDKRDLMLGYLKALEPNRLLVNFRTTAGIDPGDYSTLIGWELPDSTLRGHYAGHYMSALAQAYASTGDSALGTKMTTLVKGIHDCRDELATWATSDPEAVSVSGPFASAKGISLPYLSSQYVDLPAAAGLGSGTAFTLSMWANPAKSQDWARLYEMGDSTSKYVFLAAANGSGYPRFAINPGSGEQVVSGTTALPNDTWSHLAVTLSGGTLTLYVNGTVVGTKTGVTATPASLGTMADHWVGRSHFAADPQFAGSVSELNIWDRALSASEITALQSGPAASTSAGIGTVASFAFSDSGTSSIANQRTSSSPATLKRTWAPSHAGFVSAYPETQFALLETITGNSYPTVWAPYYTIHKILAGLVAVHHATRDTTTKSQALDLASGLCDWMYSRLSKLSQSTLTRMWSIFSSGEYGGVQEAIMDTYNLTGVAEHKALALLFDDQTLIGNCAINKDTLTGIHANQHIPLFIGIIRQYEAGLDPSFLGSETYLDAAKNFWSMVVDHRTYSLGGTGRAEFWDAPDTTAAHLSTTAGPESCCTYNMLKLSRMLFRHEQDPKYMEYYEKALFNHILGSKQDAASTGDRPLVTYPNPQGAGSVRDFAPYTGATCCEGTGMENATKYQDTVFMASEDASALYVNLFVPATLTWSAKGVTVKQATSFPAEQGTTITVTGSGAFAMRLRRPGWAKAGYRVSVNGSVVDTSTVAPGTYLEIDRTWKSGDTVAVTMPFTFRTEATPDDAAVRSVFYGPILMVALTSSTSMQTVSIDGSARLSGDLVDAFTPVSGTPMHFTSNGLEWAPFYEGNTQHFDSYAKHSTSTVSFGGTSTGVPNRTGADGETTLLDDIWSHAPFAAKQVLLQQVQSSTAAWSAAGRLSTAERQRILLTAGKAKVQA